MPAKLVAIGDSLTQGFQSGSISKTHFSYPAMIADCLGDTNFLVPDFTGEGGLPVNLEELFRLLARRFGKNIDWYDLLQAFLTVRSFLDRVEDYWERGDGSGPSETGLLHRNLAVWGFQLGDCDTLSEGLCHRFIPPPKDNLITAKKIPEFGMYRTARRTLNPRFTEQCREWTQLDIAAKIAAGEGGIDNLIFFLGPNNCLATVTDLEIKWSEDADLDRLAHERTCNLWRLSHFQQLLNRIANRIDAISANNVFVSTVPHVTIPPVSRGITPGASQGEGRDQEGYYEYYTHFWVWDDDFSRDPNRFKHLTRQEARTIDQTIDSYNQAIRDKAAERGWHVVDLCEKLDQLAFRRRGGVIGYVFPNGLVTALQHNAGTNGRFTNDNKPILDTRYLRVDPDEIDPLKRFRGGIISLDGIHPTTIGYGLVAHEFLKVMKAVGVNIIKELDWARIVDADTLVKTPPSNLESLQNILGFVESQISLLTLIRTIVKGF
ncbi:hypothetical protein [Nostoc sp. ATCC 53789]|uniref:hypothetical protein n=1 Tax=Nostoc sp. ATCC 53789 TaxID=76335 RepID=UPI000DECC42D|nr:hypothetical protein [Nostoc sp. ATCC 53789]QHG21045.1 hypothetical protein GJB62_34895 [Nostoc sp. ATCC 53789]RCJ16813.1 hypothetical protein A6V25_30065 [Nostoc sp. ATCC 53789]